jgi:hypothetical protein
MLKTYCVCSRFFGISAKEKYAENMCSAKKRWGGGIERDNKCGY